MEMPKKYTSSKFSRPEELGHKRPNVKDDGFWKAVMRFVGFLSKSSKRKFWIKIAKLISCLIKI